MLGRDRLDLTCFLRLGLVLVSNCRLCMDLDSRLTWDYVACFSSLLLGNQNGSRFKLFLPYLVRLWILLGSRNLSTMSFGSSFRTSSYGLLSLVSDCGGGNLGCFLLVDKRVGVVVFI